MCKIFLFNSSRNDEYLDGFGKFKMAIAHHSPMHMDLSKSPKLPEITIVKRNKKPPQSDEYNIEKLPSIHIPRATASKAKTKLTDFLDDPDGVFRGQPSTEAAFKVNILARDRAIQLLQQYNEIVSDTDGLAVKNVPPVKLSIRTFETRPVPKYDKNLRKTQVFTEGISSISKRPNPSFVVSKENVIRANLPNSVVVAQKKNQFSFGVKQKVSKKSKSSDENVPKFKQIRMLGLDNMPSTEMNTFINKQNVSPSSNYTSGIRGSFTRSPRRLDPIKTEELRFRNNRDSKLGELTGRSGKSAIVAGSENKIHIVSIGESLDNPNAGAISARKGVPPQSDRSHRDDERLRMNSRDRTMYGKSALAPIRTGQQYGEINDSKRTRSINNSRKFSKKNQKSSDAIPADAIQIPTHIFGLNDVLAPGHETHFDARSESLTSYQHEAMHRKAPPASPTESSSTLAATTLLPPPPPSCTSTSTDVPFEITRNMTQIEEEKSNLDHDRVTEARNESTILQTHMFPDMLSFKGKEEVMSNKGKEERPQRLAASNSVSRKKIIDGRNSRQKEPTLGNIVNLNVSQNERRPTTNYVKDGIHLSLPPVDAESLSEKRPPVRDVRSELSDATSALRQAVDSQATWYSTKSDATDAQKLTVKNLQLFDKLTANKNLQMTAPAISVTSERVDTEAFRTETLEGQTEDGGLVRQSTEEEFKKFAVSSKSLQFISPLKTIENAKRQ